VALSTDKRENWSPVNFAKLSNCGLRLLFIAAGVRAGQNDAPACRQKVAMTMAVKGGIWFHCR
jgi:hypothetical protein